MYVIRMFDEEQKAFFKKLEKESIKLVIFESHGINTKDWVGMSLKNSLHKALLWMPYWLYSHSGFKA